MIFLFAAIILAAFLAVQAWRGRPTLVVNLRDGEAFRGRRGLSPRFALVDVETVGEGRTLGGRVVIPRRNVALVQVLPPAPVIESRDPEQASA